MHGSPETMRRPGLVWIPGGDFTMGSNDHYPEEAPAHRVAVGGFHIDAHPVTNEEFAEFVAATGHVTVAETAPDLVDYPGADPALLVPASAVFTPPGRPVDLTDAYQWWQSVSGADWRHPGRPRGRRVRLGRRTDPARAPHGQRLAGRVPERQ
jgi:formylglycine-generating enzyme required for sulfatase activity